MAEKNKIDLSAYDGQIIDDRYFDWRRQSALENSRNRDGSYPRPEKYSPEAWLDCIATATSNYGDGSLEVYNPYFYKNPSKYGFRRLNEGEELKEGDIAQKYDAIFPDTPQHAYIINTLDKDGKPATINYSGGHGEYHKNSKNWFANDPTYYYRYIGTPAEREAIKAHNDAIKAKNLEVYGNEAGKIERAQPIQKGLNVERANTLPFLEALSAKWRNK